MVSTRTPLDMLTTEQAFKAMVNYLEGVYARTKSDDVAGLLGDLLMGDDGTTAAPAARSDWVASVRQATSAAVIASKEPNDVGNGHGLKPMPSGHSVLQQIDRSKPYFAREIIRELDGKTTKHLLEIWLPVPAPDGGWWSAVTIDSLNLPDMSAMPGDDPLDAVISALRFVRGLFDENEGTFVFDVWKHGKLPQNLDYEVVK
jgi:hypothetical protein